MYSDTFRIRDGQAGNAPPPASTRPAESVVVDGTPVRRIWVDDVEPASSLLATNATCKVFDDTSQKIEKTSVAANASFVKQSYANSLVSMVHKAFAEHRPLRLTPDDVRLTVLHQVTKHVNEDPEKHRAAFVSWDDKKVLEVENDAMEPGHTTHAQWREVVRGWKTLVTDTAQPRAAEFLRTLPFADSTPDAAAATDMAALDTVKAYYEFVLLSNICGYPRIDLTGTRAEWVGLRAWLDFLDELGLEQRRVALQRIVDGIVASFDDEDGNRRFWQGMFKWNSSFGSGGGGSYITGWFSDLVGSCYPNRVCKGTTSTPFTWLIGCTTAIPMTFDGGFVGVRQADDGTLSLELGWQVRYAGDAVHHKTDNVREALFPASTHHWHDTKLVMG